MKLFPLALALLLAGCAPQAEPKRPPLSAWIVVTGKSMLPTFGESEIVTLELCDFSDVAGGDTVVFWHEELQRYVHHRLVSRDETGLWQTQGDNNATFDRGHMSRANFVGRTHKL